MKIFYDAIVIGAGHAGIEAALALSKTGGVKTLVLSITPDNVGYMACNPSIGGTGKGHLVRELDALGGFMGIAADACATQIRMLNSAKGLAVRSLRAQEDKYKYHAFTKRALEAADNLSLRQDEVKSITAGGKDFTVECVTGSVYSCRAVVVATGVYMDSTIICGSSVQKRGPVCFSRSDYLATSLGALGFKLRRFKTGTPARLLGKSIDFSRLEIQEGDTVPYTFSAMTKKQPKNTTVCYLGYTNEVTHEIIRGALDSSPRKLGLITGTGARYCPSIEDKIVRFADKPRHTFFLEPEGAGTDEWYIQGISTSLSPDVQRDMYRSIAGLENVQIVRDAYAIEYECIDARELYPTLMSKRIDGLFFAGQVNGTSGYEEAAAQGLLAGINASAYIRGIEPLVLDRTNSYIGVMADDLVTVGSDEPYRMLTGRAECRLSLRQDNADLRLTELAVKYGTISPERMRQLKRKKSQIEKCNSLLNTRLDDDAVGRLFEAACEENPSRAMTVADVLKRPNITLDVFEKHFDVLKGIMPAAKLEVYARLRYDSYLRRQQAELQEKSRLENMRLSCDIDYSAVDGLRLEAREKLNTIKPLSIGQASRIPGVTPADVWVLIGKFRIQNEE
ncbi:MAG: tRNA uridine-5-carboxymethylaminomethyl(34) synthesis enzyme MnmG [Clostridiales bacterium]|nr:tRNA uridine-5-carboxymethylaminomethyl(34) synthesis enzyme MnmG [Clostridiales bacterium]